MQDFLNISSLVQAALSDGGGDRINSMGRDVIAADDDHDDQVRTSLENCFNATLFDQYIRGVVRNLTTLSRAQRREMEGDPLVYIVAVLFFYSCGIVVLLINYMKKEQNDFEETNLYKQYVEKRDRCDEFNNRGKCLNRLALQALNAVNVISQDDQTTRVAFV